MRSGFTAGLLTLMATLGLAACGEPPVPLEVPDRAPGAAVLDLAGVLDDEDLADDVATLREQGWDTVLVTFEADDASLGMADRAGRKVLEEWDADLVIVAVAEPGHFGSDADDRQRFFGLYARELRAVPRDVRERVVEELVPSVAAENHWTAVFRLALREFAAALGSAGSPAGEPREERHNGDGG